MSMAPSMRGTGTVTAPERRRHPRTSVMDQRLVTVNLDNKDAGLMVNISEGGMAVQALARIKPGATTALQFELPDSATRIEASGSVAWTDATSGRAGIRFESLAAASAECLKQWLGRQVLPRRPTASPMTVGPSAPALLGPESKVAEIAALQREITSKSLNRDQALDLIAERTRCLTRAGGAAIVLGDSKLMTCRASSGSAPPVGTDLRPESGLSGECVRTGVTVRCEDTELDPRVDREGCRSLNLRSAVIVPLFSRGNISGLLEVFYASARAFEGRDVLTLRRMADLVSATLCGQVSREGKPAAPVLKANAPTPPANPATPANRDRACREPLAPERADVPGPMIPPMPQIVSEADKVVCDVCGHQNLHADRSCEKCDVPLPAAVLKERAGAASGPTIPPAPRIASEADRVICDVCGYQNPPAGSNCEKCNVPLPANGFRTRNGAAILGSTLLEPQTDEERRRLTLRLNLRPRLLILIALLLMLLSIWGWQEYKSRQAQAAPPASITSAAGLPMPTVVSAAAPESISERVLPSANPLVSGIPVSLKVSVASAETPPKIPIKSVASASAMPAESAAKPSTPILAVPSQPRAEAQAAVAPPPLVVTASLPVAAALPVPPAVAPALSPGRATLSPAQLLRKVDPEYPKLAQASRVQGPVLLKATILRSGRLGMIQVVSGNELLAGAAVHAIQQWRYKPAELDGKPVETDTMITVKFSLGLAR